MINEAGVFVFLESVLHHVLLAHHVLGPILCAPLEGREGLGHKHAGAAGDTQSLDPFVLGHGIIGPSGHLGQLGNA